MSLNDMVLYGLIGRSLSHSFSPTYFAQKFEALGIQRAKYTTFPLAEISDFPALLKEEPRLHGLNVTIPYKQAIIPYLDLLSPQAKAVGAVNTIAIETDGRLVGHNTDVPGFQASLEALLSPQQRVSKALILGTGGAAKAVAYALDQLQIAHKSVSRTPTQQQLSYKDIDAACLSEHLLIINTTPLGMYPAEGTAPTLPYLALSINHLCYDLVYNPTTTKFMEQASRAGAQVSNGLAMLHLQADKAWEIWQNSRLLKF